MLSELQIQQTFRNKVILFGILNWGLGHATRMVPLINEAIKTAKEVVICSNGNALLWLKNYYPHLKTIELNAQEIEYGTNKWTTLYKLFSLSIQYPSQVASEKYQINKLVKDLNIDLIVSDNRPGVYSNKVHSIYITHQLNIKAPFGFSKLASKSHQNYYTLYNEIWVPDFKEDEKCLAGDLSRNVLNNPKVKYIGPLSRFNHVIVPTSFPETYDLAVISGPEPQRTKFEEEIIKNYNKNIPLKIFRGVLNNKSINAPDINIEVYNSPSDVDFARSIFYANKIYCRSGYSTIMDLFALNKLEAAIFTPTPGQTEQEYLKKYLNSKLP